MFEQQKELLLLQLEKSRIDQETEIERRRFEQESERAKFEVERQKLEVERIRLQLIEEGKMSATALIGTECFDVAKNVRLLPKSEECNVETFFNLFERVAEAHNWPETGRTMMLQCVLTGRAQEAYSALSVAESRVYVSAKTAVLKAYELVPEAYHQRFRGMRKCPGQTYTEFAQELTVQCNRWCSASQVESQEELFNLILVEQFKNCLPKQIATYVSERNATTGPEAATLADDYALIHKARFFGAQPVRSDRGTGGNPAFRTKPAMRTDTPGAGLNPVPRVNWIRIRLVITVWARGTGNLNVRC